MSSQYYFFGSMTKNTVNSTNRDFLLLKPFHRIQLESFYWFTPFQILPRVIRSSIALWEETITEISISKQSLKAKKKSAKVSDVVIIDNHYSSFGAFLLLRSWDLLIETNIKTRFPVILSSVRRSMLSIFLLTAFSVELDIHKCFWY